MKNIVTTSAGVWGKSCYAHGSCRLVTWPWVKSVMFCTFCRWLSYSSRADEVWGVWCKYSWVRRHFFFNWCSYTESYLEDGTSHFGTQLMWWTVGNKVSIIWISIIKQDLLWTMLAPLKWRGFCSLGHLICSDSCQWILLGPDFKLQGWRTASLFLIFFQFLFFFPDFNLKEQILNCISWFREDGYKAQLF